MGALTKLFSSPNKNLATFFLKILPELLRLTILLIYIIRKSYKHVTTNYNYTSAINKRSSKFHYRKKRRPDLGGCSVCLTDFAEGEEVRELVECKHAFHRNCLEKWLREYKATCPLCRNPVVPEAVVAEYRRMQVAEEDNWIEEELALILLNALEYVRGCNGFF